MQPATPFKTGSWITRATEMMGGMLLVIFAYGDRWAGMSLPIHVALVLAWLGYAFIRFCSLIHWHQQARRGEGLEQQFMQVAVAAIYGFAITNILATAHILTALIYPIAVILIGVSAINATLLYIYRKDCSTVPINFYSHHKTCEEES